MVFSSTIFVFGFLPIVLLGSIMLQKNIKLQNIFLLIVSLLFYAWGEPGYVFLMMFSIVLNWLAALMIDTVDKQKWHRNFLLIVVIAYNIGALFVFKYWGWSMGIVNRVLGTTIPYRELALPIGISFYTFQAMSYVIDVWRKDTKAQKGIIGVGMYVSFFPQLGAGPIVRYGDIEKQLFVRKMSVNGFSEGITRFLTGFSKKILLADNVAVIADRAFAMNAGDELSGAFAWLGAAAYTFQIFFDFSGYSDMAIGLGKMLGFTLPENFNYPYRAYCIKDFWRRWHISLSVWFRDYVYIPLGGNRKGHGRTYINLALVWLLTGLWHGANLTFVLWGMLYGALIIFERIAKVEARIQRSRLFGVGYRIFTCICIMILWVIFRAESIGRALSYVAAMFDVTKWLNNLSLLALYLREYKWELTASVILSTVSFPSGLREKNIFKSIRQILLYVFFIISISYLVKGTYSPFIYFNF